MTRLTAIAALLLSAPALAATSQEGPGHEDIAPGESSPPTLKSWIPPVSGQGFTSENRFEISPGIGFSLDDPFFEKFVPQLSLGYHIKSFYVGVAGGYAISTFAGNVTACTSGGSCGTPTASQQNQLPGQMSAMFFGEGGWTPIYGKINLFGEKVVHFDFSLLLGVGGISVHTAQSPQGAAANVAAGDAFSFALTPGIGEHVFLSEHVAIAAELRDYVYFVGTGPSNQQGAQNQLMFNLGLSFLLGGGSKG